MYVLEVSACELCQLMERKVLVVCKEVGDGMQTSALLEKSSGTEDSVGCFFSFSRLFEIVEKRRLSAHLAYNARLFLFIYLNQMNDRLFDWGFL